jgi:senataxin
VHSIEVNTVDAFQGREKDFIIISTVRSEGLGFLKDLRRMNVAITRARHFLWVIGNSNCLNQNPTWKGLISRGSETTYTFN